MVLPSGATAQRPVTPVNGMIRYNSENGRFEGYQAGAWQDILTGSALAAAPDRGIQFNSGGNFAANANFVYSSQGSFMVSGTHTGTGAPPVEGAGTRMYFDPTKSAFRAGNVTGAQWDNANTGVYSTAMGQNVTASGFYSTAIGSNNTSSGTGSVALGINSSASNAGAVALGQGAIASGLRSISLGAGATASGDYAFAAGQGAAASGADSFAVGVNGTEATAAASAAIGENVHADGINSVALGRAAGVGVGADNAMAIGLGIPGNPNYPTVVGDNSLGIFMRDQASRNLNDPNTMGLFGGRMVIDPRIQANNMSADTALEVEGTMKMAYGGEACDVAREGAIHYDSASNNFYVCKDAGVGSWDLLATGTPSAAAPDRGIQFNSGGNFAADSNFVYTSAGRMGLGTNAPLRAMDIVANSNYNPVLSLRNTSSTGLSGFEVLSDSGNFKGNIGQFHFTYDGVADPFAIATNDSDIAFVTGDTGSVAGDIHMIVKASTGRVGIGTISPQSELDVAGTGAVILARGATAQRPVTPVNGMIRYNSENGRFEGYQAGAWQDILTGSALAAAPDRGIQFNSGGNFTADADFVYTSQGSFMTSGTYTGTGAPPVSGAGTRMFFDPNMAAFRAGTVTGAQWDDVNLGSHSVALGYDVEASGWSTTAIGSAVAASGSNSSAFGFSTLASGHRSMAMGSMTATSGYYSTALGRSVVAGDYDINSGFGDGSMAIGLIDEAVTITLQSQVRGIQSMGVFMGDQDGLVMTADNTVGFFGGQMVIDPRVPAQQLAARSVLDLGAATDSVVLPSGATADRPGAPVNGMIRYNSESGKFEGYQAGTWQDIVTGAAGAAAPDRGVQFNSGGSFAASAGLTYSSVGTLGVDGGLNVASLATIDAPSSSARASFSGTNGTVNLDTWANRGPFIDVNYGSSGYVGQFYGGALTIRTMSNSVENGIYMGDGDVSSVPAAGITYYDGDTLSYGLGGLRLKTNGGSGLTTRLQIDKDGLISFTSSGAVALNSGTTAQRPASPTNGMLRYNSETGKFEGYQAGAWQDIVTGAAGGSASAPDRGIQFNSGGNFAADSNFVYTSQGALVVSGTYTGAGTEPVSGAGTRMFFDPGKSAFRAGTVSGDQWNFTSTGDYSFAAGYDTEASGESSVAMGAWAKATGGRSVAIGDSVEANNYGTVSLGAFTTATGNTSVAIGNFAQSTNDSSVSIGAATVASGMYSLAMGSGALASGDNSIAMGNSVQASGAFAMGLGLGPAPGIPSVVSGDSSLGVFMGDQNGIIFSSSNTMGLFGGRMVIDPRVPAQQLSARGVIDVGAATDAIVMPYGATSQRPSSPVNGMLRYNSETGKFEGYQAGSWQDIVTGAAGGSASAPDRGIQFNSGGSFAASSNFTYSSVGYLGLGTSNPVSELDVAGTGAVVLARGTTAQRPSSPVNGMIRYNSQNGKFEGYQAGSWQDIVTGAAVSSFVSLTDTPASYAGGAGQFVRVNSGETGLEFTDQIIPSVTGQPAPALPNLDDLGDVSAASPNDNDVIRYNSASGLWETSALGSMVSAASPDRGVQFNSGGALAADALMTYQSGALNLGTSTAGNIGVLNLYQTNAGGNAAGLRFYNNTSTLVSRIDGWDGSLDITAVGNTRDIAIVKEGTTGNSVLSNLVLSRYSTGGAGANGIGSSIESYLETTTDGTDNLGSQIETVATDAAAATFTTRMTMMPRYNNAATTGLTLLGASTGTRVGINNTTPSVGLDIATNDAAILPRGGNAQRPTSPVNGMIRYNSEGGKFEGYQAGAWADIVTGAAVSSFLGLTDTPSSYAGSAGYFVKVNPGESGLTFSSSLINTVSGVPAPTGMNLDHLDDVSAAAPNDNDVIRYNSASGQWETSSLGSLVSAASPDRGIQFNSGGNFAADGNFVYKADGDISLKGTHTATASGPGLGSYSGFYFDVQSSSIRAGQTISGVEWMDGDIGTHSTAFGRNVIAKGNYSFAQGNGATAEGESAVAIGNVAIARDNDSIAIGRFTETSGLASLALGRHVQVGDQFIAGSGDGSAGLGLFDDATVISTRPQVLGIQSLGIFMGNQDSVVFSSSNTMGLFGGNLVIDPNAPSTQLSARGVIDVGAATDAIVLPKGTTAQRPGSAVNGMLRYNSETGKFEGYQAGSWQDIVTGAAGGSASAPDRGIQFNSAGSFAASSNFTYSSAGYLGLGTSNPVSELDVAGTGAVVLARGTTAQRPSSPVNGMIRYNSQNDKFEGYQAGSWQDIVTGAATGTFVGLTDTPASYGGSAGYFVKVNAGESGLTFSSSLINNVSGQPAPVGLGLVDLDDVTISAPTAGQVLYYSSSGGGQWVNGAAASSAIDDLSDARVGYSSNSMYLGTGVGAASSASGNVGVGPMVMQSLAVGINNTAFGSYALSSVTNGSNNTAIGINTLKNATISSNNIAIGAVSQTVAKSALEDLTWGNRNVAVGSGALSTTTRRGENVAVGYEAMGYSDSTATLAFTNNTALGSYALRGSTTPASNTGTNNTAIGHSALVAVTSGGDNVALGYNAGSNLTTGSGNIVIGSGITFTSATASNQLNIGNTIYGDMANDWVGIGNSAPSVALDVTGDIEYTGTITDVSDRRLKENIHPLGNRGSMLEKLAMIDTFSFTMKGDKDRNVEFGVMAQDIRRIFPELVREDQTSPEHYLSVNYIGMIAPIVEATKELKAENDMLKAELAALKSDREQMVTALNDLTRDVQGLKAHTGYGINKASVGMGMLLGMLAAAAGSGLIIVATGIARRRRHNTGA
ncbi:MAG: tail fiber domain-containing protein [Micavibrio aeruginosavorus]|uniref:Tail fiber domain-containing protein n=1 Tax=Micavibrio aeruginosavorus TaxID=349221 RepID=A0A7T5R1G0_9BACT|nr:MAG: tail fiber domain-containing protein [Micavibrio aeruginosavorus]